MPNEVTLVNGELVCTCGAKAQDNSSESKRFKKRHPDKCSERQDFTKQLARGTRSVDYDQHLTSKGFVSGNTEAALTFLESDDDDKDPRTVEAVRRLLERK